MTHNNTRKVADELEVLLADTYFLALKTQNYHWNITGPHFPDYHVFLEEQYDELYEAGDDIAERIRALGFFSPGSFQAFSKLATISEETGNPDDQGMIQTLLSDHEKIISNIKKAVEVCGEANDPATEDFFIERLRSHDKTAWMLRSTLKK